jgi:hypothetical protein
MKTKDFLFCNENDSDQDSSTYQESSSEESIPNVSESDLESFTKGDDNDFEKK